MAGKIYKPAWIFLSAIVGRGQAHRDISSGEMLGVWPVFLPVSCALEWIISSLKLLVSHKMFLIQWVGNIRLFPCGDGKLICTGWERPKWQTALEMVQKGKRIKIKRNGSSGKVPKRTSNQSDKSMQQLTCSPCPVYSDVTLGEKMWFLFCLHCSALLHSSPSALGLECPGLWKEEMSWCCLLAAPREQELQEEQHSPGGCPGASAAALPSW